MLQIISACLTDIFPSGRRTGSILAGCAAAVLLAGPATAEMYEYDDIGRLALVTHDDGSLVQ
jgi:hypothetical protein